MVRMFLVGFFFLLGNVFVGFSQVRLSEGKIIYDISYDSIPQELLSTQSYLAKDAVIYFKGTKSRTEMGVGPFGKNVTISDQSKGTYTILLKVFDKRMALHKTDSDMQEFRKSMGLDTLKADVEITNETKKIQGYLAKKALIKRHTSKGPLVTEVWYCPDIQPFYVEQDPALKKIDGMLLEFSIQQEKIKMNIRVRAVFPAPIDDSLFEVPDNYQHVTEAELTRIMSLLMLEKGNR